MVVFFTSVCFALETANFNFSATTSISSINVVKIKGLCSSLVPQLLAKSIAKARFELVPILVTEGSLIKRIVLISRSLIATYICM